MFGFLSSRSWIAVISRYGDCSFEDKVRNAMKANFSAAIVYNVDSNKVQVGPNYSNCSLLVTLVISRSFLWVARMTT